MAEQQVVTTQSGSKLSTIVAVVLLAVGGAAGWFLTKGEAPVGPVSQEPWIYAILTAEFVIYMVLIGLWGRGASSKSSIGALLFAIAWRVGMAAVAAASNKDVPIGEGFSTVYLKAVAPAGATIVLNIIALAAMRRRFFPTEIAPLPAPAEAYALAAVAEAPPEVPVGEAPAEPAWEQAPVVAEPEPLAAEVYPEPAAPEAPPVEPEAPLFEAEMAPAAEPEAEPAPAETTEAEAEDALAGALAALAAEETPVAEEVAEEEPVSPFEQPLLVAEGEEEPLLAPPTPAAEEEQPLFAAEETPVDEALFAPTEEAPSPFAVEEAPAVAETFFAPDVSVEEPPAVAEEEPAIPAEPAAVVEEELAPAGPPGVEAAVVTGEVRISAESVLAQFPAGALAMDAAAIEEHLAGGFRIPVDQIMSQLAQGEVRVPVSLVVGQLPPGALTMSERDLNAEVASGLVELPIEEVVPQLSPAMLAQPDQVEEEFDIGEEPLFEFELEEAPAPAAEPPEEDAAAPAFEPLTQEEPVQPEPPVEAAEPIFEPVTEEEEAAAPAEPAQAPAAPPIAPAAGRVRVRAESVMAQFPIDALGMSPEAIADTLPEGCFEVAVDQVLPQLSEGEVRVSISMIVAQLPADALVKSERQLLDAMPDGNVELPLEEVVPQLTDLMAEHVGEVPEVGDLAEPLFSFEDAGEVAETAEEIAAVEEPAQAEEEAPLFAPEEEVAVVEEPAQAEEEVPLFAPQEEVAVAEEPAQAEEEAPLFAPEEEVAVAEEPPEAEEEAPLFAAPAEPTPEPELAAVQPAAVPETPVAVSGKVSIAADVILSQIPSDAFVADPSEIAARVPNGVFLIDEDAVAGQLTAGEIRVPVELIADQFPEGALAVSPRALGNELPDGTVELPLGEIVPQLSHRMQVPAEAEVAAPEAAEEPIFAAPEVSEAPKETVEPEIAVEEPAVVEEAAPAAPEPEREAEPAAKEPAPVVEEPAPPEEAPALMAFAFDDIGLSGDEREHIAAAEASGVIERLPEGLKQVAPGGLAASHFLAPHGARVALVAPETVDEAAACDNLGGLITHAQRMAWAMQMGDITALLLQAEKGSLLGYAAAGPEGLTVNVCLAAPAGTSLGKGEILGKRALVALKDFRWEQSPFVELAPWDRAGEFSATQMPAQAQAVVEKLTRAYEPMGARDAKLFARVDGRTVVAFGPRPVTAENAAAGSDLVDAAAHCADAIGLGTVLRVVFCAEEGTVGAARLDPATGRTVVCAVAMESLRPAKSAVEVEDAADALAGLQW